MNRMIQYKASSHAALVAAPQQRLKGYGFLARAMILFSAGSISGGVVLDQGVAPLTFSLIKVMLGCILVGLVMLTGKKSFRLARQDVPGFIAFGFIAVGVMTASYLTSASLTNVSTAIILTYTAPAFTLVLAAVFLKERITRIKLLAVLLSLLGTVLVVVGYNLSAVNINLLGVVMGLLAGLSYAVHGLLSRAYIARYSPWTINFYSLLFGTLGLMLIKSPMSIIAEGMPGTESYLWILGHSVIAYLGAFTLYILGFRYLDAGTGSILTSIQPGLVVLLAAIFLHERLYPVQIAGLLLMMLAMVVIARSD